MDLQPSIKKFLDEGDKDVLDPETLGIEHPELTEAQKVYLSLALDAFLNRHWFIESKYDYR
jgi:hypothetical protein